MGLILEAFHRRCRDHRHAPALWSRGEGLTLSFAELAEAARQWEQRLAGLHEGGGSAIAVATGNRAAFPALFFALLARGVAMVPMDGALALEEKIALCRRLGIRTLLSHEQEAGGEELSMGVFGYSSDSPESGSHGPGSHVLAPVPVLPAGTVLVKLTSGSTGEPRGVCLTEEALAAGIEQIGRGMELRASERVLIAIPLSHSYGFDNGVLSLAWWGTPLVLEPGYFPASLLRALEESEANFFPAVPPMIPYLAESEWPASLRERPCQPGSGSAPALRVISAGGPLDPAFARCFRQRTGRGVHQFYGSTETGGISFERHPEHEEAASTVGHPLPGVEVSLGEEGEIRVDSPANFLAYWGEAPREARRVTLGDRGELTADGRLRLTGRLADMLNVGGKKVSATAIEHALREIPGILDAAVVAVPDAVRGDRAVAFVVGDATAVDPARLPTGLAPRDLRLVEALPYTARGKLDRCQLRRLAGHGSPTLEPVAGEGPERG